ncbi:hypothetical protein B0F90DRAFT_1722167, partial [Multifurca ochricompacta]
MKHMNTHMNTAIATVFALSPSMEMEYGTCCGGGEGLYYFVLFSLKRVREIDTHVRGG